MDRFREVPQNRSGPLWTAAFGPSRSHSRFQERNHKVALPSQT
jgi:hypothetical protein